MLESPYWWQSSNKQWIMLLRVKDKAEQLQRHAIMLKINVKKTIKKIWEKCKVRLYLLSRGRNEISFCSALLKSEKSRWKIQSHVNAIGWTKHKQNNVLFTVLIIWTQFFLSFYISFLSWKNWPERRKLEEKRFHSVIQTHLVNASILFLTTSINCRSYSPTRSMFLLEKEAWAAETEVGWGVQQKMLQLPVAHTIATCYFERRRQSELTRSYRDIQGHTNITCRKTKTFNKHG